MKLMYNEKLLTNDGEVEKITRVQGCKYAGTLGV